MGAGFKDFASGAILTAGDVDNYLMRQTIMTFADASARDTALSAVLDEGMAAYLEDTDTVTVYDGSAWNALGGAGGAIVQVVRATDTTDRTTTSTSFVDVTGMSVTITPESASNYIVVIGTGRFDASGGTNIVPVFQLTDSSNTALSGAEGVLYGQNTATAERGGLTLVGYAAPATTSAVTYKMRFRTTFAGVTVGVRNASNTGQMYAIEVTP